jgi:hypothetical protein
VPIEQKGCTFASQKLKGKLAVRYEIAVTIITGEIAWINGPFQAGKYSDLHIFREGGLQDTIDLGERDEADDGYRGDPTTFRVPYEVLTRQNEEADNMQKRVQGRHETINARLKKFAILRERYRHEIIQISVQNGDPLYDVDYKVNF